MACKPGSRLVLWPLASHTLLRFYLFFLAVGPFTRTGRSTLTLAVSFGLISCVNSGRILADLPRLLPTGHLENRSLRYGDLERAHGRVSDVHSIAGKSSTHTLPLSDIKHTDTVPKVTVESAYPDKKKVPAPRHVQRRHLRHHGRNPPLRPHPDRTSPRSLPDLPQTPLPSHQTNNPPFGRRVQTAPSNPAAGPCARPSSPS